MVAEEFERINIGCVLLIGLRKKFTHLENVCVKENDLLSDLGLDSLDVVESVMIAEKQFMISIPDGKSTSIKTIGDFVTVIQECIAEKYDRLFPKDRPPVVKLTRDLFTGNVKEVHVPYGVEREEVTDYQDPKPYTKYYYNTTDGKRRECEILYVQTD